MAKKNKSLMAAKRKLEDELIGYQAEDAILHLNMNNTGEVRLYDYRAMMFKAALDQ